MILRIRGLEIDLDFTKNNFCTLEVFHPIFLRQILESFLAKDDEIEDWICRVYDGEKEIEGGGVLISNPLDLSEVATMLNKKFKKYLTDNFKSLEDDQEFAKLALRVDDFAQEVATKIDFEVDFDETNFDKFIKIANFRPRAKPKMNSYKQSIYDIIDLMSELSPNHILCFLNIKHFISQEEFENILQYASVKEQKVLFLESSFGRFYAENEKIVVVDDDLYTYER